MFICIIAKIQPLSIPKNTVKIIYSVSQSFTAKEKEKWNYGIFIMKTKKYLKQNVNSQFALEMLFINIKGELVNDRSSRS